MKRDQKPSQNMKFQVKQPPNFINFYKKLEEQKLKEIYRKSQQANPTNVSFGRLGSNQAIFSGRSQRHGSSTYSSGLSKSVGASPISNINSMPKQFPKYETDTKNVFYQDRQQAKFIKLFQTLRPMLNRVLFYLFLTWFILMFINGYKGFCPHEAEYCGVYIHCKNGFKLINDQCVLTDQKKQEIQYIGQNVVQNLQSEFARYQFQPQKKHSIPTKRFSSIIDQYQINDPTIENLIQQWFRNYNNQQKYKFSFRNGVVIPNAKKYTLISQFRHIINSQSFIYAFILGVIVFLFILALIQYNSQKKRALKIYQYLKKRVNTQKDIIININQIHNKFGRIYSALWQKVDRHRVQEKAIFIYEDDNLHWKLI